MSTDVRMVARQHVYTTRLLGVDFLPVRIDLDAEGDCGPGNADAGSQFDVRPGDTSANQRLLDELHARHDRECPHCSVVRGFTNTVFGEGAPDAALMFIGEAPGEEEDRSGRPFVGRAGQKLDEIIKAMSLSRQSVYIANVLKARPPENRTPLPDEVAKCSPYLREQIRIIRPRVIVALGGPSAKLLLQSNLGITRLRGQWGCYVDSDFRIPIMPTFHPAYLLRNYTVKTRKEVWSDMQAVLARLKQFE